MTSEALCHQCKHFGITTCCDSPCCEEDMFATSDFDDNETSSEREEKLIDYSETCKKDGVFKSLEDSDDSIKDFTNTMNDTSLEYVCTINDETHILCGPLNVKEAALRAIREFAGRNKMSFGSAILNINNLSIKHLGIDWAVLPNVTGLAIVTYISANELVENDKVFSEVQEKQTKKSRK